MSEEPKDLLEALRASLDVKLCKVCLMIRKSVMHKGKLVCPMCGVPRPGQ